MRCFKYFAVVMLLGAACLAVSQTAPVVVRSGAITLKVPSFGAARDQISQIAEALGGHIVGGQDRLTEKGRSHGWLRLVVPANQLDASMQKLRTVGSLYGDTVTAQNLSLNVKDLESRTARLQQHQDRLSDMLKNSKRLRGSDMLFVQDRLFRAGVDQDLLGHRREQMIGSADVSSISVFLFEPGALVEHPPVPKTFWDKTVFAFGSAWKSFSKFMEGVGLTFASLVVYGLVWVPILFLVWLIWRRFGWRVKALALLAVRLRGRKTGGNGDLQAQG